MRRALGLSCLALSCSASAPAPTKVEPPPAPTTSVAPSPASSSSVTVRVVSDPSSPAAREATCAKLEQRQHEALRRARANDEELRGPGVRVPTSMGTCLRSGTGAWMLALGTLTDGGCPDRGCATLRWNVVHVASDGSVAEGAPQTVTFAASALSLGVGALFDWDGDGEPEILVRLETGHVACQRATTAVERSASLWSARSGSVQQIPVSAEDARDVDGDGRPDLISRGPYSAIADRPCIAGAPGDTSIALFGPELPLRSRPDGTFVLLADDARRTCPERPTAVVARPKKNGLDLLLTARNVACGRMWGKTTEEITAELDRHRGMLCDQARGRCAEIDVLRDWARKEPPVVLGR